MPHDVGIERSHQVHDLPKVRIKVSRHDVYRVRCACGTEHLGSLPAEVSTAPAGYGVNLKSLAVYLLVYQHVPVQRCVRLIADLTGGSGPSDGFVHGMGTRCATAVAEVVGAIKTLITPAHVVGFDETTLRCGAAGQKKYVLSASTENATAYRLGGRDLDSFAAFGVLPRLRRGGACTTATAITFTPAGINSPDTRPAQRTCCATSPTPPRPTPMRTGPLRQFARCAV
jgi:hypothetical protein